MSTGKKRRGKQRVRFARTEPPPSGSVVAFPSQGPRSVRPSDAGEGGSLPPDRRVPDPLPGAAHPADATQRTSILEAELADLVGDADAPPPSASPAARSAGPARVEARAVEARSEAPLRRSTPASTPLAEGSLDDEDTVVGADVAVPRAPRAPTHVSPPGRSALEYEDDVTAVDVAPLGSRAPGPPTASRAPAAARAPAPADADYPEDEVTPAEPQEAAHGGHADAHEPHEERFFSTPPAAPEADRFDDLETVRDELPVGSRRARNWTLGIGALGAVVIGAILVNQYVVQPAPAELGAPPPATLPDPSLLDETARVAPEDAPEGAGEPAAEAPAAGEEAAEAAAADGEAAAALAGEAEIAESLAEVAGPTISAEQLAAIVALPEGVEPATGSYDELVEAGREEERKSNFDEAERYFRSALAVDPKGGFALAHLAFILLNQGQTENARSVAEYAVALVPENSTGWITLGSARQLLRDYDGAREAYRACVQQAEGKYVEECRRMMR